MDGWMNECINIIYLQCACRYMDFCIPKHVCLRAYVSVLACVRVCMRVGERSY